MTYLIILWSLMLFLSIYTHGNAATVFALGYITALIWAGIILYG
jgi:hypothetical protein